ncbi:hypothetical protein [Streptomyces sp. NPDC003023]|uniref:hypothetical protein n=1 Tax=Streptomyces sp. NPDC003023 TaxID=3364675 RepID=UPI003679A4D5
MRRHVPGTRACTDGRARNTGRHTAETIMEAAAMGKAKAKLKELRGRMKESDGIVLENERMKEEGRRRQEEGRAEAAEAKPHGRHRRTKRNG